MNRRQVLAVLIGGFVLGYLLVALFFFPGFGRRAIVTVPDLRGRSFAQARRLAGRQGLELERGPVVPHATMTRGAVLAQSPLPGQETTRGDQIRVILSAGPHRRAVPDVSGLLAAQARDLLLRTGFQVRLRTVQDERPAGRLIGIQPAAGSVLALPAAVELRVSSGPPPPPSVPTGGLPGADAPADTAGAAGVSEDLPAEAADTVRADTVAAP